MASPWGQRTRSRSKAFQEGEEVDLIASSLFRKISEATGETLEAVYRLIDGSVDDAMYITSRMPEQERKNLMEVLGLQEEVEGGSQDPEEGSFWERCKRRREEEAPGQSSSGSKRQQLEDMRHEDGTLPGYKSWNLATAEDRSFRDALFPSTSVHKEPESVTTSTAKIEDLASPEFAERHEGVLAEETMDARKTTKLKINTDSSDDDDVQIEEFDASCDYQSGEDVTERKAAIQEVAVIHEVTGQNEVAEALSSQQEVTVPESQEDNQGERMAQLLHLLVTNTRMRCPEQGEALDILGQLRLTCPSASLAVQVHGLPLLQKAVEVRKHKDPTGLLAGLTSLHSTVRTISSQGLVSISIIIL